MVDRLLYRRVQIVFIVAFYQMSYHLGVGFRGKLITCREQVLANLSIVFNYPVMHYGDTVPRKMWVGIGLGGFAMGGPAGMGNTDFASLIQRHPIGQLLYLAQGPETLEFC